LNRFIRKAIGTLHRPVFALAVIFLCALIPRVTYIAIVRPGIALHSDETRYLNSAEWLWTHGEFCKYPPEVDAHLPVLYPLFLSPIVGLFGPTPVQALYLQAFLGAVTACLAYLLGRRLCGNLAGCFSGLFLASYVPMMRYAGKYLTETLAVFWMMLGLLLVDYLFTVKGRKSALITSAFVGAVFAAGALTRVVTFPLVGLSLLFYVAIHWKQPRRSLPVAATAILFLP